MEKEKSQISWRMLGRELYCDFPTGESVSLNIDEVHESWKDFIFTYGIKQWAKDGIAGLSFKPESLLKANLLDAQVSGDVERIENAKAEIKNARGKWMKENSANLRTEMFKSLKSLKEVKPAKTERARETKAELVNSLREKARNAGMTEEMIKVVFG